jgi:Leucine-rich repeat (LRR) protein
MVARQPSVTALRSLVLVVLFVVLFCVLFVFAGHAQAITFGEWAANRGWAAGHVMPTTVYADHASIDSLAGVGDYDWTTRPAVHLDLTYNQITNLEPGDFAPLGTVSNIDFGNNQLTSIEPGTFVGLENVIALTFDHNQIGNLSSGAFAELGNLKGLHLSYNQITNIESGAFSGLGSLTSLDLYGNEILRIDSGDFDGLANLKFLHISGNAVTYVESDAFAGLGNLDTLDLQDNQITIIKSDTLVGLGSLRYLNLSGNRIARIEPDAFAGLGSTFAVYLSGNNLATVESGTFAGMDNLTSLDLSRSNITNIEPSAFTGLGKLTSLNLDGNPITAIESAAFTGLVNLHTLRLSQNPSLTDLNLEEADFSALMGLDLTGDTNIARVSLKNMAWSQTAMTVVISGGKAFQGDPAGIGELPGVIELDLSGVDFAEITDLSPLYLMDNLTDLWLVGVQNMDADSLDVLLDNLDTMQNPGIEGVLYLTQADFDMFNTTGGGKLALWDAEPGHHVQIVPEPGALVMLAGVLGTLAFAKQRM